MLSHFFVKVSHGYLFLSQLEYLLSIHFSALGINGHLEANTKYLILHMEGCGSVVHYKPVCLPRLSGISPGISASGFCRFWSPP